MSSDSMTVVVGLVQQLSFSWGYFFERRHTYHPPNTGKHIHRNSTAPVVLRPLTMASPNLDHSHDVITLGKIYPNTPLTTKASASSPGSLLVNVSKARRNVCQSSKQDPKTCGGENTHFYLIPLTYTITGKTINKRELRIGLAGLRPGEWCV